MLFLLEFRNQIGRKLILKKLLVTNTGLHFSCKRLDILCRAIISNLEKAHEKGKIKVISVRTPAVCAEHALYLLKLPAAKSRFNAFNFQKPLKLLRLQPLPPFFNSLFCIIQSGAHIWLRSTKTTSLPSSHFLDNSRFTCGEHAN